MPKFLFIFLTLLYSCSTPEVTVLLDWTVNTNHTGLYVAIDQKYFEQEGIKVKVEPAPSSGVPAFLTAGQAQFAFSYQEEILQSRSKGLPLTAIAAVIQNNTSGFASPESKKITRPKDLEGKKYGGWGSDMEKALLEALVRADGGDPSKVEILTVGEMDYFAATDKLVDFEWIFEGWTGIEAQIKGKNLNYIRLKDFEPALNYYTPLIATTKQEIDKDPELVKKFLRALSKGYEYAISNPEKSAEILLKMNPDLNRELVRKSQIFLSQEYKSSAKRWGEFDQNRWNGFFEWMKKKALISDYSDKESAYTNDFLPVEKK